MTSSFAPAAILSLAGTVNILVHWLRDEETQQTCVSAPGKVLITGGYLVLDPKYSGLVLGTSARFYTTICTKKLPTTSQKSIIIKIVLFSPQFHYQTNYTFIYDRNTCSSELVLPGDVNYKRNPYIEYSIVYAMTVAVLSGNVTTDLDMTIRLVADNDFYSQRQNLKDLGWNVSLESLQKLPKFYSSPSKHEIHKTGLGSSAAMVTSLTASILTHFNVVDLQFEDEKIDKGQSLTSNKEIIHRVAQLCHCLAQGKIGSGFDVASATFGSQKYTRFDPSLLEPLFQYGISDMEQKTFNTVQSLLCTKDHYNNLYSTLEISQLKLQKPFTTKWNTKHDAFQLPPLFHLFVADVDQGSNTPNMVRSVLQWRKENPQEALKLWTEIDQLNTLIEKKFNDLTEIHDKDSKGYKSALYKLSHTRYSEWESINDLSRTFDKVCQSMTELRVTFIKIRAGLKNMGKLAFNEPIEPDQQSALLDATMNVPGCLIAGVPGAGGFDAIFSILFGNEQAVKDRVASLWLNYKHASVCPLILNESMSKGVVKSNEQAAWK